MVTVTVGYRSGQITVSPDPVFVPPGIETIKFKVSEEAQGGKIVAFAITENPNPNPFAVQDISEPITILYVMDINTGPQYRQNPYTYAISLIVGGQTPVSSGHQIINESS
jgi:LEA14-like dessication related protein